MHTCTDTWAWCYVKRSSLVLVQTLDAALQGAGLPGRGGPPSGRGSRGVAGLGDHTIYGMEYICIYGMIYSKKQTMHSLVAKHINYWHPHGFFPVPGRHSNILVPKIWGTKKSLHALDISHQKLPSLDDFFGGQKMLEVEKICPVKNCQFWIIYFG